MGKSNREVGGVKRSPVAFSYARFSDPRQEHGDSIRRQTDLRDGWLQRNKVPLDTSLVFVDKGKSAFKDIDREALTEFLQHVEGGRVQPGDYLILEQLDRLSRAKPGKAVGLLLDILNAGVRIVQLLPRERVFDAANLDTFGLFEAVFQLSQGHEESLKKSERLGHVWAEKRRKAAEGSGVLTTTAPGWLDFKTTKPVATGDDDPEASRLARRLKLASGKFVLNKQHTATVRRIFRECIDGHGAYTIAIRLTKEGVPTWGRAKKWTPATVLWTLRNRAAMGEYQPFTEHGTKGRVPAGEPILGYYPAAVDEETWALAQKRMEDRRTAPGRKAKMGVNLFRGRMYDARDGERMGIMSNGRLPVYTSSAYRAGGRNGSFPVFAFEAAILSQLREVKPADILPAQGKTADRVTGLTGELEKVKARLAMRQAQLEESDDENDPLLGVVRQLSDKVKKLTDELNAAKREAASPLTEAWSEVKTLVGMAGKDDDTRTRLRAAIARVVESIWVLVIPGSLTRWALVEVHFKEGAVRHYCVSYRRAVGGAAGKKPAEWKADPSFKTAPLKVEGLKDYRFHNELNPTTYGQELAAAADVA